MMGGEAFAPARLQPLGQSLVGLAGGCGKIVVHVIEKIILPLLVFVAVIVERGCFRLVGFFVIVVLPWFFFLIFTYFLFKISYLNNNKQKQTKKLFFY